jgi:hypothetical protein
VPCCAAPLPRPPPTACRYSTPDVKKVIAGGGWFLKEAKPSARGRAHGQSRRRSLAQIRKDVAGRRGRHGPKQGKRRAGVAAHGPRVIQEEELVDPDVLQRSSLRMALNEQGGLCVGQLAVLVWCSAASCSRSRRD